MKLQLIEGEFSNKDAIELITQMIEVKIRYHEKQISTIDMEEDIKWRESKIKNLQNQIMTLKTLPEKDSKVCKLYAEIHIQ